MNVRLKWVVVPVRTIESAVTVMTGSSSQLHVPSSSRKAWKTMGPPSRSPQGRAGVGARHTDRRRERHTEGRQVVVGLQHAASRSSRGESSAVTERMLPQRPPGQRPRDSTVEDPVVAGDDGPGGRRRLGSAGASGWGCARGFGGGFGWVSGAGSVLRASAAGCVVGVPVPAGGGGC